MSLTHDDISEHLRKKLGGSVSSLESLKAEGGGSRSSLNESLNLDDFENDTVIWSFFFIICKPLQMRARYVLQKLYLAKKKSCPLAAKGWQINKLSYNFS